MAERAHVEVGGERPVVLVGGHPLARQLPALLRGRGRLAAEPEPPLARRDEGAHPLERGRRGGRQRARGGERRRGEERGGLGGAEGGERGEVGRRVEEAARLGAEAAEVAGQRGTQRARAARRLAPYEGGLG